jgi:hypothetical protein
MMQRPGSPHASPDFSIPTAGSRSIAKALWANCLVLIAILLVLLCKNEGSTLPNLGSPAYGQQMPIGGGAGVFIVPGQFSVNTWGCYLMDVDAQTLSAYQFYPGDKQLRLIASRYFRYDRKLKNFNTTPSPDEVSQLIAREQDDARVKDQLNAPANPEGPAKSQ